jgi:hypothetical protein
MVIVNKLAPMTVRIRCLRSKRERHGERFDSSPCIETIKLSKKSEVKIYDKTRKKRKSICNC